MSHDNLKILLETLEKEMEKIERVALDIEKNGNSYSIPSLQPSGVIQSIKLVVKLMGSLETREITDAINGFKDVCNSFLPHPNDVIILIKF